MEEGCACGWVERWESGGGAHLDGEAGERGVRGHRELVDGVERNHPVHVVRLRAGGAVGLAFTCHRGACHHGTKLNRAARGCVCARARGVNELGGRGQGVAAVCVWHTATECACACTCACGGGEEEEGAAPGRCRARGRAARRWRRPKPRRRCRRASAGSSPRCAGAWRASRSVSIDECPRLRTRRRPVQPTLSSTRGSARGGARFSDGVDVVDEPREAELLQLEVEELLAGTG